jgi:hypothetical protein
LCSHSPRPTVHLRSYTSSTAVIRSIDMKSWTYARRLHFLGSHERAPVRSAMSAQTRRLTWSPIRTAKEEPTRHAGPFGTALEPRNGERTCNFNVIYQETCLILCIAAIFPSLVSTASCSCLQLFAVVCSLSSVCIRPAGCRKRVLGCTIRIHVFSSIICLSRLK